MAGSGPLHGSDVVDDYDPFDAFNKAMGADTVETPYPDFVALRADGHLHDGIVGLLPDGARIAAEGDMPPVMTACSFAAAQEVLKPLHG